MKNFKRLLMGLCTLFILLYGTVGLVKTCNKIMITTAKFIVIRDNASYYNEQHVKTNELDEMYECNNSMRQALYNSEDLIVRLFSNAPLMIKLVIVILTISMYVCIILFWKERIKRLFRRNFLIKYLIQKL